MSWLKKKDAPKLIMEVDKMGPLELQWYDYLLTIGLFAVVVVIGLYVTRGATEEDYFVGGRRVPWIQLALSIAAGVLGGGVMMVFSQFAYSFGFSSLCIIGGIVLGTFLLVPVAIRYKNLADKQGFYSLPDLFRHEWGRFAGWTSTTVVAIWTLGFIAMQLIAAGFLLKAMTGLEHWVGVVAAAAVVASYLVVGGFRSVIITDCLQYVALGLVLIIVLPASFPNINWGSALEHTGQMDPARAVGFFFLGGLNMVVSADLWQRIYAARSPVDARRGVQVGALLVLVGGLLLMAPALASTGLFDSTVDTRGALVLALRAYSPRILLGLAMAAILMSVMSTLDTMVFVLSLSISHDFLVESLGKSVRYRKQSAQIAMVLSLLAGAIVAAPFDDPDDLLNVGIAVTSIALILAPPVLISRPKKKMCKRAVNWSLSLGLAVAAVLVVGEAAFGDVLTPENSIAVLGGSIIGAILGTVVNRCWPTSEM